MSAERCRVYLMPGMRCQGAKGHAGLHTNDEDGGGMSAEFLDGYVDAMLWANAYRDNAEGEMERAELSHAEIAEPRYRALVSLDDARAFYEANRETLTQVSETFGADDSQHGHDFALTRAHHGAGFWDRGYGELGDTLTEAAQAYGDADVWLDAADAS